MTPKFSLTGALPLHDNAGLLKLTIPKQSITNFEDIKVKIENLVK
jgi:hypothetical protein